MRRRLLACCLTALLASGCGGSPALRPGVVEARGFYYGDDAGLSVVTAGVAVDQRVSQAVTVTGRAVVDHLKIVPPAPSAPTRSGPGQATGHDPHEADAVTAASSRIAGGAIKEKTRVEGLAGARVEGSLGGEPAGAGAEVRVSHEPDYLALSGLLRGRIDLFQQNLTLTGFAGYGRDRVSPLEAPPGQTGRWPAIHQRFTLGLTSSQILSPTLILSGGASVSRQFGVLESPYRRALVRTSVFPEALPPSRDRVTAFVQLSWHLGWNAALHLRQGAYADDWGVLAVIPEGRLLKELGARGLMTLRYRFYRQSAAWFHRARYQDVARLMSSDPRLGVAREHAAGAALEWTLKGARREVGSITLEGGYDLSILRYEDSGIAAVTGHVAMLGVIVSY